jgi:hypothetical protein
MLPCSRFSPSHDSGSYQRHLDGVAILDCGQPASKYEATQLGSFFGFERMHVTESVSQKRVAFPIHGPRARYANDRLQAGVEYAQASMLKIRR